MQSSIPREVTDADGSQESGAKPLPNQGLAGVPRSEHSPLMQQRLLL